MECLVFNEKIFAPLGASPLDNCHGFYERNGERCVSLYKCSNKSTLEAYIVSNAVQGHFVVSASMTPQGPRYMFSTNYLTEKWLGCEDMGLMATDDAIRAIRYVELAEAQAEPEAEQFPRERHG